MERWKYKGTDPRLDYGTVYDLTVARAASGASHISVHKDLKARVYKQYANVEAFAVDWSEPDAG